MNVNKVAIADFAYAGKRVKKGDEIELPRMDARVLEAVGKIADPAPKVEKKPEGPKEKSKYHTKDMKAE